MKGFTPTPDLHMTGSARRQWRHANQVWGFTLIEVVVATGIFALLITLFVGIFGRFVAIQKGGAQTQIVLEELRGALEVMNREMRTGFGSTYAVADSGGRGVTFRNQDGMCVHYQFRNGVLERAEAQASGIECDSSDFGSNDYSALTGSEVAIETLRFDVIRAQVNGDSLQNQGSVTVMIAAGSTETTIAPVELQSTVTSRQVIPYIES